MSSLHPDNPYHPDKHKMPAAYPLVYTKKSAQVEAEEREEAKRAGRPNSFIRDEVVGPNWKPGIVKRRKSLTLEIDLTHGILTKAEVATLKRQVRTRDPVMWNSVPLSRRIYSPNTTN